MLSLSLSLCWSSRTCKQDSYHTHYTITTSSLKIFTRQGVWMDANSTYQTVRFANPVFMLTWLLTKRTPHTVHLSAQLLISSLCCMWTCKYTLSHTSQTSHTTQVLHVNMHIYPLAHITDKTHHTGQSAAAHTYHSTTSPRTSFLAMVAPVSASLPTWYQQKEGSNVH